MTDKLIITIFATIIAALAALMGWGIYSHIKYENSLEVIERETRILTITHVNYPKHFDVNGIDNKGVEWRRVGNSKHCNRARGNIRRGQHYPIHITKYRDLDGRVFLRLNDYRLNRELCGR